jgi:uncharacterized protein
MALVADSGAIYAIYDASDRHHAAVTDVIAEETGSILIPMVILAEIDYLLRVRLGSRAVERFLEGISVGGLSLEPFTSRDLDRCRWLLTKYADLDIGLADAAVLATAERTGIRRILTVDERHFRALRPADGKPFRLLPADA